MMSAKSISSVLIACLVFIAGWQTGRVMSPYYSATPIIFQDLVASSPNPSPITSSEVQAQGKYVASKNSSIFHDISCPTAKSIKEENRVWFASAEEAKAKGYKPSACTQKLLNVK